MDRLTGEVDAFDDGSGLGEVRGDDGRRYFFHCTQIADGTRTTAVGTPVAFVVVAGRMGRWEAAGIVPRPPTPGPAAPPDRHAPAAGAAGVATFVCPVCGGTVEGIAGGYEICGACNWEDDPVQHDDPHYAGGANALSLHEARLIWQANHEFPQH